VHMMMSAASSSAPTTDLRILLIEPDEDTRHLLELALSARGHRVTSGGDAEEAWRALQKATYPFIVLNRELPDIDGLRLCRQVRSLPGGQAR
jgi:DNA-binding response OmpR family regulator